MGDSELVKEHNFTSISKADVADGIVDVIIQSPPANQTPPSSIGPVTPVPNRQLHLEFSSPLTVTTDTTNNTNSQTPKETLFDSFTSPGTDDKLMLAPHQNKYKFIQKEGSCVGVVRRLTFADVAIVRHEESITPDEQQEEEHLFQIVYRTIVDAIVSEQQQNIGDESPMTPPESCLKDIVEKQCPGAPIKPKNKYNRINLLDRKVCRKLKNKYDKM